MLKNKNSNIYMKLITSSMDFETGLCSIDWDNCAKLMEKFNKLSAEERDLLLSEAWKCNEKIISLC